jgi:SAM-dependent methyltransferase
VKQNEKTHYDYLPIIGGTHATAATHVEEKWNQYYHLTYTHVVGRMIGDRKGVVLDVGTSHGHWLPFLKQKGFSVFLGVEVDPQRAKLAKQAGYHEVYACDAAQIPHPSETVDVAISTDVFVHILRIKDKVAVLQEVERLLKPGGVFILNHPMSKAFGFKGYHVLEHCSFLSLHEFITLIRDNTSLLISDIKPTYYKFRNSRGGFVARWVRYLIRMPLAVRLLFYLDYLNARDISLEDSDAVYVKLVKSG